ncbi:succinate CoA transferase [Alicyclobacillus mali]|uniref:Succinate CoA transferase n=1 Tax=Alicyclobacillus mali (ex Roth et al. 2021) TaxID=1123961 RepID=A0ABS0F2G8_9BACL|nr:succinate CoA transferase [Alicyclobacillus mali (ex Roth et al. 2021)]MBF8377490.1 succinate CoA transferase [Alicyclobacillus mali (ex Roth et al. 2021)]
MFEDRIRNVSLRSRVLSVDEVQGWIHDGMTIAVSGFTKSGDAKAVLKALSRRISETNEHTRIRLLSGASLGDTDKILAEKGVMSFRLPFQSEPFLRDRINRGDIEYVDQHLSETAEWVRSGWFGKIDFAIIEATAITEDGGIIPTTSVGNSPIFVEKADKVIVEINLSAPLDLEGVHDIYVPAARPHRKPIPLVNVADRIGTPYIPCSPEKIVAIVLSAEEDTPSTVSAADPDTHAMAEFIQEFLVHEVRRGRLPRHIGPLQIGIGSVTNAVLSGFENSPFDRLELYTEVMQDAAFELLDAGKVQLASSCSFTLSRSMREHVLSHLGQYKNRVVLRPQEISNHPEIVRRLGVIAINAALEVDIYGNVNSTHVFGTRMMNGIGGSGDFARNAALSIFVTRSIEKGGRISSIVPFATHVDHPEHDVDVIVTERGIADLRGLSPRQRAREIISHLVHPDYKDELIEYVRRAESLGGHTPHVLSEAWDWHFRMLKYGDMRSLVHAAQSDVLEFASQYRREPFRVRR